jgi:hypothetical protein
MTPAAGAWALETDADGIAWLNFDRPGSSTNVLSRDTLLELDRHHQVFLGERLGDDARKRARVELQGIDANEFLAGGFGERAAQILFVEEFLARVAAGKAERCDHFER